MSGDTSAEETLEALVRETEALKQRLEEERQKLNDTTLASVAERLEPVNFPNLKPRRVLKGHQAKVLCTDWCPDKRHIVSSSQDGKVIIWDAFSATREMTISMPSTWVMACAYAPSGTLIAAGGLDNKVMVCRVCGGEEEARASRRSVGVHAGYTSGAGFVSDRVVATAGGGGGAVWDVDEGAVLTPLTAHHADVLALDVAPTDHGDLLVTAGADRRALVWDLRVGRPVHVLLHPGDVNAVRYHPAGDALATGGDDAVVRIWDLRADRELAALWKESALFAVTSVEWSPSGRVVFAGYGDHTAAAWDALRGQRVCVLCGHEHRVTKVQRAPDGTALSTASWDATIRVWA